MLQRLLNGGEQSDFIILCSSSSIPIHRLLEQFLDNRKSEIVLLQTVVKSRIKPSLVSQIIRVSDPVGLNDPSREEKFPPELSEIVNQDFKRTVVIESLTDLLVLNNPTVVARYLSKLKTTCSNQAKLLALLHSDCIDEAVLHRVQCLANTVVELAEESEGILATVLHKKQGGKLCCSQELVTFGQDSIKIEPFAKAKAVLKEEDDLVENLTTFNLSATKESEKEARDKLVLPFYKEEQKKAVAKEEVRIHKEPSPTSAIYYEPDSGDDWDDDDPDDDLDF